MASPSSLAVNWPPRQGAWPAEKGTSMVTRIRGIIIIGLALFSTAAGAIVAGAGQLPSAHQRVVVSAAAPAGSQGPGPGNTNWG